MKLTKLRAQRLKFKGELIRLSLHLCLFASLLLFAACATSSIFEPLGDNISSPNGMAIDAATNRLYLINSNSNVLYDWRDGSIQIYDLTDPLSPRLMSTIPTESFSGEAIFDSARKLVYTSNRFSEQTTVTEDHMLIANVDESSTGFGSISTTNTLKDPYGLACCYPADRMWIATGGDALEYLNLNDLSGGSISLLRDLSNGGTFTRSEISFVAILGNQAFVPRVRGGLLVVNLDEADDSTKNPVDYWIDDFNYPQGVATDGTYIYLADSESIDGKWTPLLFIIDPSLLPPLADNTTTEVLDKEDAGLVLAQIEVAKNPQKVLTTSQYAFVTCEHDSNKNGFVSVVDLATRTKVKDIEVGEEPFGMALYAPGGVETYLYVGNVESNTLSIIDIATLSVVATYP